MKTGFVLFPFEFTAEKGLNSAGNTTDIDDKEASQLQNFDFFRDNVVSKRRGISLRGTAAAFNTKLVRLIGQYAKGDLSVNHLLASPIQSNLTTAGPLYYSTDGGATWSACRTAALATPNLDSFMGLQYNDVFYIFTKSGGVYSWVGPDTLTAIASTPNGYCCTEVLDYLFTVDPSNQAVRYSAAGTPTSWPAANSFQVGTGDGQLITGLVEYKDRLVIFQDRSIYVLFLTGTPANWQLKELSSTIGCTGIYANVVKDDWIYFIGQHGVYRTNLSSIECISDNIQSTSLETRTSTNFLAWGMWDSIAWRSNKLVCCINTGGVETTANRRHSMFVFNMVQEAWVTWLPAYTSAQGNNFIPPINMLNVENGRTTGNDAAYPVGLYFGAGEFNGQVYFFSNSNNFNDNGVAFTAIYRSKTFNFDDSMSYKKIPEFYFYGAIPTGTTLLVEFLDVAQNVVSSTTLTATSGTQVCKIRGPGFQLNAQVRLTYQDPSVVQAAIATLIFCGFLVRIPKPTMSKAMV